MIKIFDTGPLHNRDWVYRPEKIRKKIKKNPCQFRSTKLITFLWGILKIKKKMKPSNQKSAQYRIICTLQINKSE